MFVRLQRSGDIRAVFAARLVAHGSALVVHGRAQAPAGLARATVVAGRKVGRAVLRNRAKRRLRHVLAAERLPEGMDLVVVARAAAVDATFDELRCEARALIGRVAAEARPERPG